MKTSHARHELLRAGRDRCGCLALPHAREELLQLGLPWRTDGELSQTPDPVFCVMQWKVFCASALTCAAGFEPPKQRYPRGVFPRLFDLKCDNSLNRNCSDCAVVQLCFAG